MVQIGSALNVKLTKAPAPNIRAGDSVQVTVELTIPSDFPIGNNIQVSSDLQDQVLAGELSYDPLVPPQGMQIDKDRLGNWIIYGWLLTGKTAPQVTITFTGTVPQITSTQNVTILHLAEMAGLTEQPGSYILTRNIVNPQDIIGQINSIRDDANKLRQNITADATQGIDTATAQEKYTQADSTISQADSLKTTNADQAVTLLTTAQTAIHDGYLLLDKSEAQYQIAQVQTNLTTVEDLITYFEVNRSISSTDSRIVAITTKHDLASKGISDAHDAINSCPSSPDPSICYATAKARALDASKYAADAYNLSVSLKNELGTGGFLPSINPLVVIGGIVVVLVIIGGVFVYRRYFQWDELG